MSDYWPYDPYQIDPDDPYSILNQPTQYNPSQGYPLKKVSDQEWDLMAPTSDSQVSNRVKSTYPWMDAYSQDAFWAADPMLRGPLAEALAASKGDTIDAYDYINSPEYQDALRQQIGKTEWNQLREQGILSEEDLPGEELDRQALDYYMRGLENLLATGSPTSTRNAGLWDVGSERYGGRPYPGGDPTGGSFEGPGFAQPERDTRTIYQGRVAPDVDAFISEAVGGDQGAHEQVRNTYSEALKNRLRQSGLRPMPSRKPKRGMGSRSGKSKGSFGNARPKGQVQASGGSKKRSGSKNPFSAIGRMFA
jgi:hypothetical protein